MNTTDLRVIKTKENIWDAFIQLLREKPLENITVTELAKKARISKGTFYLHYQDIYALYDEVIESYLQKTILSIDYFDLFFTDPEQFCLRFSETFPEELKEFRVVLHGHSELLFQPHTVRLFRNRLYETGLLARTENNNIRLEFLLYGLLGLMPQYMEPQLGVTGQFPDQKKRIFRIFAEFVNDCLKSEIG